MAKTYDKIIQSQTEPSTQSLWLNKGTLKYYDGAWHIIGDFQHGNMMEQVNTNVQKVQATANEAKTKAESAQSSISDLTTVVEGISNTLDTTTTATEAKQKAESNASSITGFNQVAINIRNDLSTLQTIVSNIQTSLTDVSTTANQAQSTASGAENLAQTNQTAITELGEVIDTNKNVIGEMFSKGVAPIEMGIFEMSEGSPSVLEITDKDKIQDIINASVISYSINSADFPGIFFAHPFHRTNNGNMSENVIIFFTTSLNLDSLVVLKVIVEPNNTSASATLYTA